MEKPKFTLDFEKPLRDLETQLENLRRLSAEQNLDVRAEIRAIEEKLEVTKAAIHKNLNSWQKVQLARHPLRPYSLDYIQHIFTDFEELHGDRLFRDDQAIVGGPAWLDGKPVMLLGQQKGRKTKENIRRNFGMPNPEGYRKALRLMRLAEKFRLPLIALVDTAGAYPGIGAEERHVAEAIAVNLREMSILETPIIAVIIGEGGSGGALGIAVADVVLILENAYYSVISPEGCAAILWKDRANAPQAAEALQLTADKLLATGAVDGVIPEPLGGAHLDPATAANNLKAALVEHLDRLRPIPVKALLEQRYQKFRRLGVLEEITPVTDAVTAK
ncbi:MAG: acetyl-CoA carboxylase carboxyltransferase subunit alpha [Opitutales bacterium]